MNLVTTPVLLYPRGTKFCIKPSERPGEGVGYDLTAIPPRGDETFVKSFPTDEAAREHIRHLKSTAYYAARPWLLRRAPRSRK